MSPSAREVTRVVVKRNARTEAFSSNIVVMSCGAINSAALLLRSANDKHSLALANSDVVGRHYMGHVNSLLMAVSKCPCRVHGHDCHQGLFSRNLFIGQRIPLSGLAHQNVTIRFGRDLKTSALDVTWKAHDLDNLYVVDASFFPSSGALNPALTIMPNALRVAEPQRARLS